MSDTLSDENLEPVREAFREAFRLADEAGVVIEINVGELSGRPHLEIVRLALEATDLFVVEPLEDLSIPGTRLIR